MDAQTARDVAAKRKAGQQTINKFADKHEEHDHEAPKGPSIEPTFPKKRGRGIKRTDSFALNMRIPAKYEYAVLIAATMAKAAGELKGSVKRDDKQAYLEQVLMSYIEELFEEHPIPQGKK